MQALPSHLFTGLAEAAAVLLIVYQGFALRRISAAMRLQGDECRSLVAKAEAESLRLSQENEALVKSLRESWAKEETRPGRAGV